MFAYMVLGRVEQTLEAAQSEDQHGFRSGRRLQEHVVTANLFVQKLASVGKPVLIISLDLSKAFDKLQWDPLWRALHEHGVSEHMIWILQCLCEGQEGIVLGESSN